MSGVTIVEALVWWLTSRFLVLAFGQIGVWTERVELSLKRKLALLVMPTVPFERNLARAVAEQRVLPNSGAQER